MIRRLLHLMAADSNVQNRRRAKRTVSGMHCLQSLVEVMEERLVLSPTSFPFQVTVQPDMITNHNLLISDVTNDNNGNGILNGAGKTGPTFTVSIDRNGDTTPSHDYEMELLTNGQTIATTGLRPANSSSVNLSLTVGANGLPLLPIGESEITVRFKRPGFPAADLTTVRVRVNADPFTQDDSFLLLEGSALNELSLTAFDPDNDTFTVRIDSTPAGGQLFRPDGSLISAGDTLDPNTSLVRYTPGASTTGSDSFLFSAFDNVGGFSAQSTASITLIAPPDGIPRLADEDNTGQDRDNNGVTDPEPIGLIVEGLTIDVATSRTNSLTLSLDLASANNGEFIITNLVSGISTSVPATKNGVTFFADVNLAPGVYSAFARLIAGFAPAVQVDSDPIRISVDTTSPAAPVAVPSGSVSLAPGSYLTTDLSPEFVLGSVEANAMIIVERTDLGGVSFQEIARLFPSSVNGTVASYTDTSLVGAGTYTYRFLQVDIAGNQSISTVSLVVDNAAPVISNLTIDNAPRQTTPIIDSTQPVFSFNVADQRYADLDNPLRVELINQNGQVLASTILLNPAGVDESFQQAVTLAPSSPLATGQHTLRIRVIDQDLRGLGDATAVSMSQEQRVTITAADTEGAPGTPVYTRTYDLRTIGTEPGGVGGDVFLLDSNGQPTTTKVNFYGSHVWQTSFDKTTQTVWVNFEHGLATGVNATVPTKDGSTTFQIPIQNPATMQFDPATGRFKLFDYKTIFGDDAVLLTNTDPASDARNPHGNAFDFDGHINPRIWIAHRNASPATPSSKPGNEPRNLGGDGRISYIEVRPDAQGRHRVVTYDVAALAGVELTDMHAAFVDARGTMWFTSAETSSVLEIDFDLEPDPSDPGNTDLYVQSPTLDSTRALVRIHTMPAGMLTGEQAADEHADHEHSEFHGHAIKVAVDDQTGEQYVWIASVGGTGQVALLRPRATATGEDVWTTWDVPIEAGGSTQQSRNPFVEIDDNETTGDPTDDRIVYVAPVSGAEGVQGSVIGIVQVLDPGLIAGDPLAVLSSTLRSYQVKGLDSAFAATNQPFLDREGGIYWIDRLTGIGRIDIGPAQEINQNSDGVPVTSRSQMSPVRDSFFLDVERDSSGAEIMRRVTPVVGFAATSQSQPVFNEATQTGVNQYRTVGANSIATDDIPNGLMGARGQGLGAFRGAINASNVLYGAHTTTDEFSYTVFAETARRQVAVVRTSETLRPGALVEGRKVFQVVRTSVESGASEQPGVVLMTYRNDGEILDRQVNLTSLVAQQNGVSPQSIGMSGDVSVVRATNGDIYVAGRGDRLDVIVYRFDSQSGNWSILEYGDGLQVLAAEPTAVLVNDPQHDQERLVMLASDSQGRLLLFEDGTAPTVLTPPSLRVENTDRALYGNLTVIQNAGDGSYSIYAVNQQGGVVNYVLNADLSLRSGPEQLNIRSKQDQSGTDLFTSHEIQVFQSVTAVDVNGFRHLFGNDGTSRLVHLQSDGSNGWIAENVSKLTAPAASGYFGFQQDYASRVYSEIAIVQDDETARLFVYGTNGGDLVEFTLDAGNWSCANLTNDLTRGSVASQVSRVTANNVFGAPDAYLSPNGARHVLQINVDGEIVEYILHRNGSFATQNINLARGNSVSELRKSSTPPAIRLPSGPPLYIRNGNPVFLDTEARLTDGNDSFSGNSISFRVAAGTRDDLILFPTIMDDDILIDGISIGTLSNNEELNTFTVQLNATASRDRVQSLLRQAQYAQRASSARRSGSRLIEVMLRNETGATLTRTVKGISILSEGTLESLLAGRVSA
jgi:hypothetical protein